MPARAHRVCYVLLYDLAQWRTGLIRPERQPRSMAALARKCDMSEATLRRALAELESLGWVTRIPNPGRGKIPGIQVQPGRDAPQRVSMAMTSAERSRNYRDRRKADQESVTHHGEVSAFTESPSRESDATNHVRQRDDFAGQDGCPAVGGRRDEGEVVGMPAEAKPLTVTIAGRVHPAEACRSCGEPVPSRFAYDGCHMMCAPPAVAKAAA
jgi:DNA-binding HxlR family transcriptional regulator